MSPLIFNLADVAQEHQLYRRMAPVTNHAILIFLLIATATANTYTYVLTATGSTSGGSSSLRFSTGINNASAVLFSVNGTLAQLSSVLATLESQCDTLDTCLGVFLSLGNTTVTGRGLNNLGTLISTTLNCYSYTKVRENISASN